MQGTRYQVVGEIGRGGMGVVLRAHDSSFDRPLAIKVLLAPCQPGADQERRFLEEAGITGRLQHPGIPPAHEVGRLADGRPYFSMKLIEGRTLADLLAERTTPQTDLPRFLKTFEQIAQTLAYAHSQRVIHRDLKPSNVMVGAFGEVQVMDWGLAKRLPREAAAVDPQGAPDESNRAEPTSVETVAEADTAGSHTQAGQVLGTFSYMAPEQARGEVHTQDERCDVFGLGAILCAILTGKPPYRGKDGQSLFKQAQEADLTEAWDRLDACGTDVELVRLARACLAPRREDRPQDAGEVATAVTTYLASVQERLQQARVAAAQAEVRAREERKRRRLGFAVFLLVIGFAAAGLWYLRDRERREAEAEAHRRGLEREVGTALDAAARQQQELRADLRDNRRGSLLLSNLEDWRKLLASAQETWTRADRLAASDPENVSADLTDRLASLSGQLQADERDRQVALQLDKIRLESAELVEGAIQISRAAPKLKKVYEDAGYNLAQGDSSEVAARLRESTIRLALVAGVDFWALTTRDTVLRAKLLQVARLADPDPWRHRVRQAEAWGDKTKLEALAAEVDCAAQSPQLLGVLAQRLDLARGDPPRLLRRAAVHHPRDFWLFFELAHISTDPAEQIGAFRTALSIRPESPYVYFGLGVVHAAERKLDAARACYEKAIELDPRYAAAHSNLGVVLQNLKMPDKALVCYRRAIELDRLNIYAWISQGTLLQEQNKLREAEDSYRRAVEIDPQSAAALNNLGTVLRQQTKLDDATRFFRLATRSNPNFATGWCNLGHTLKQKGEFAEALAAFRRGHELGSRDKNWAHPSAQWVKETEQAIALEKKLTAVLRGEAEPADWREQLGFAELCLTKKHFAAATRFFIAAFASEPKLTEDFMSGRRYNAACAASLAAAGQGLDATQLEDGQKVIFRKQASAWLRAELTAWGGLLEQNPRAVAGTLKHWQADPDLAGMREDAALVKLAPDEQGTCRQFWADVAALRQRAVKSTP
jgi:Tfp pilus assembly protein PilF